MQQERGRVSAQQLLLMITGFTFGSTLVLSAGKIGQDNWAAVLVGFLEGLIIALLFVALARRFPGRNIAEISETVFGRWLGKLVTLLFIWFAFQLGALVIRNFADFIASTIMIKTPTVVMMLVLGVVAAHAAWHGIEVIGRTAEVLVIAAIFSVLLTTLLLTPEFDTGNLRPALTSPLTAILKAGHGVAAFPFAETVVFLFIFPYINRKRSLRRSVSLGLALAAVVLLIVALRNIVVLGPTLSNTAYPSFQAARQISIAGIITRLEVLVAINFLSMGFIKLSVLLYASAIGTSHVFRLHSYKHLVLPVMVLMIILAITGFNNLPENIEFAQETWPVYAPLFEIGLPLFTLITAIVRRLPAGDAKR